jgi:CBS domain-containing protein
MRISEIMTAGVKVVRPEDTIRRAAQLMDELNIGSLPVCNGRKLVGIITDRDITVWATAAGRTPDETRVSEAMSEDLRWCYDDDDTDKVMVVMKDVQIRRIPVVDRDKNLVGIVALGDIAARLDDEASGETLKEISTPAEPDR